ncbi:hypothetical protein ACROYT_G041816 [Oculina patagonica]
MEDLEDDPAKQTASNFDNTCRCCNKTVLLRNHPVYIFGEKSNKEPELLKVLEFLTGKEVKSDDGFPNKLCQPCFRKVKTVIEFRSLSLASLSKQELSIKATGVKRMCASQQVGDSPSSSQQTKKSANSVNREGGDSVRMCLFAKGGQNQDLNLPRYRPIAPKSNVSAPRRLPEFLQVSREKQDINKEREVQTCQSPAVQSVSANILRQSGLRKYEVNAEKDEKIDCADAKKIIACLNEGKAKTIAETVMGIEAVKKAVKEQFLRDIDSQCQKLCLTKKATPSVLNVTQDSCVEALNHFSWEKVMVEMRDRSPDVLDVLATISKQPSESQVPPVCFGYAVLMYQRNSKLGMLQKLLSILLGSGGCSRRVSTLLSV